MPDNAQRFDRLKDAASRAETPGFRGVADLAPVAATRLRERVTSEPTPEYLFAVYEMLVYLDRFTSYPVGIAKMSKEEKQAYTMGYARPLKYAGIPAEVFLAATERYLSKNSDYPKSPGAFIPFAETVMRDREPVGPPSVPSLPGPPVKPETRQAVRERLLKDTAD